MTEFIEFTCECGKEKLKVPKKRAGQKGRCAHCGIPIRVPLPTPGKTLQAKKPSGLSSLPRQELNKKIARPARSQASSSAPTIAPIEETSEEFLSTDSYQGKNPKTQNKAKRHQAPASSRPSEVSSGTNEEKFWETVHDKPYRPATPKTNKPQPVPISSPETKSSRDKRSFSSILVPLLTFVIGVALGALLRPYWDAKEFSFSKVEVESKSSQSQTKTASPGSRAKTPASEQTVASGKQQTQESSTEKEQEEKLVSELFQIVDTAENYLLALGEKSSQLRHNISRLSDNYQTQVPEKVTQLLNKANQRQIFVHERLLRVREELSHAKGEKLIKLKQFAEPLAVPAEKSRLIQTLDKAIAYTQSQLRQRERASNNQSGSLSSPRNRDYMGPWYGQLLQVVEEVENISQKNLHFSSMTASLRMQKLKIVTTRFSTYQEDIKKLMLELQDHINLGNDLNAWLQKRRESAITHSQIRRADILEEFWTNKLFELDISKEYQTLSRELARVKREIRDHKVQEEDMAGVLQAAEAIDRKYEEVYQDLNSAVINFTSL